LEKLELTGIEKETYEKPAIKTETMELGVYGQYGGGPIQMMQPFFGICCN